MRDKDMRMGKEAIKVHFVTPAVFDHVIKHDRSILQFMLLSMLAPFEEYVFYCFLR